MVEDKAVLVSINRKAYPDDWIDKLLENGAKYQKRLNENRAYRGMPVFLYDTEYGIRWIAEVIEICEDVTFFGNAFECEPITKKEIQNIPITIHLISYFNSSKYESLIKLVN